LRVLHSASCAQVVRRWLCDPPAACTACECTRVPMQAMPPSAGLAPAIARPHTRACACAYSTSSRYCSVCGPSPCSGRVLLYTLAMFRVGSGCLNLAITRLEALTDLFCGRLTFLCPRSTRTANCCGV
jgi:hypothetical protein